MLSILLVVIIILMVMRRNFDFDIKAMESLESFNPISDDEEFLDEEEWLDVEEFLKEEEDYEDYSDYFPTKRYLTYDEEIDKMNRKYSKRGKHGHKGYTRVQTIAYKKAREFKKAHLEEWC